MLFYCGAGHGKHTAGKRAPSGKFEEREWFFNNEVVKGFIDQIKTYNGVKVVRTDDSSGETDVSLATRTNKANNAKADAYFSFHHNASTAKWGSWTGTEVYYSKGSTKGLALAKAVAPVVAKAYGLANRGVKNANLHITRETHMPAILIEGGFMDSTIDIKKLRDKKLLRNAGIEVAKAVAKHYGLSGGGNAASKPSKPSKPSTTKPYTQDAKYPKLENYGANVLKIQKLLNKAGYKVDTDKSFGPATDKAVRRFQKDKGLAVDGQAGPATQKALNGSTGASLEVDGSWGEATSKALQQHFKLKIKDGIVSGQPKNKSTRNIPSARYGSTGSNLIRAMQRHYKSGTVDGVIGNANTGKSSLITAMQRRYGLSIVDGMVSNPSNIVKDIQRRLNNDTL